MPRTNALSCIRHSTPAVSVLIWL